MRVAVIDGQGGGIGRAIVEKLKKELQQSVEVIALGTNVAATAGMLKAGADEGASGENAIVHNVAKVDMITGAVGILMANSMMGELTPAMARAVAESPARKILIPLNRCGVEVVGVKNESLPQHIDSAVATIKNSLK